MAIRSRTSDITGPKDVKPKKRPDVRIAIMGPTGTGKSSLIRLLTGDETIVIGNGLGSVTEDIQLAHYFDSDDRRVTFIDTPGFDDSRGVTDATILRKIATFLDTEFKDGRKLNGLIYLQRITDNRMGGVTLRNLRTFKKLCGSESLRNVAVVTTRWDQLIEESTGVERERELKTNPNFFQPLAAAGARFLRHNNTPESASRIMLKLLENDPIVLQIQKELAEGRNLQETEAGTEVNQYLNEVIRNHKEELERVRKEMREAFEEKNKALEEELKRTKDELYCKLGNLEVEKNILFDELEALKAEVVQKNPEQVTSEERHSVLGDSPVRYSTDNISTQGGSEKVSLRDRFKGVFRKHRKP